MAAPLTVPEICVIFGITTFEAKEGNLVPLYNSWTPFLENKIRSILIGKGWSVLYTPTTVVIRKRLKYFIGSDFLDALRKKLNAE